MAITTDSYIDVAAGGITYDKIGLSKTLDNYTITEIKDFHYCSMSNPLFRQLDVKKNISATSEYGAMPNSITGEYNNVYVTSGSSAYRDANGAYSTVYWLEGTPTPYITEDALEYYKIVTEWDAGKYVFDISTMLGTTSFAASVWASSWDDADKMMYAADPDNSGGITYHSKLGKTGDVEITVPTYYPYCMYEVDGKLLFYQLSQTYALSVMTTGENPNYINHGYYSDFEDNDIICVNSPSQIMKVNNDFSDSGNQYVPPWNWGHPIINPISRYTLSDDNLYCQYYLITGNEIRVYTWLNGKEQALQFWANCGLHIKAGSTYYKPIIYSGYVGGYTDQLETESEIDEWQGSTRHDVAPSPPSPPSPGGDYEDDPWHGVNFSGVGVGGAGAFAKVYYMTATELANLRSWMNSISVPEGFDPMQQIIGLSQVPVALSGSSPENVVFVNSSAVYDPGVTTRAVDTGVATQQSMGTPIRYSLGSVNIVRRMQERGEPYLDYDCQIELYLPLIGMFSLDTQAVMGRTITAEAVLDPISGTLAAYAYVSKDGQNLPVAYGSTTIGVDLPVTAQQLSVSRAALKQANAQLGTSLLSSALSLVAMTTAGGAAGAGAKTSMGSSGLSAAGIREAGSDYMKASQVGNVFGDFMNWGRTIRQLSYGNNTAISGSFGGSAAQWSYPFTPYVKIIRPRYEKPSNFAHSQGVPCVQSKTVGRCTGFIQCINPDVSGITRATDLERQAIQAALANGVFAGGGSK